MTKAQDALGPDPIVRAMIGGRVQGVGYRAWTLREAAALGLDGWVRNRLNGDVEAVCSGPAPAVEALCALLWRGPPAARVARVEVTPAGAQDLALAKGGGAGFRQIATI